MSDELTKKNTAAFKQAIEGLEARDRDKQEQIDRLHTALGAMTSRMTELERQLGAQKAASYGSGPSVR